ncbi:MAG: carboxylesterase/lipase family protein [Acidobacteriota bacterium]
MAKVWMVLLMVAACAADSDGLTVKIDSGTLHGGKTGTVRHFLGVPYAAPPVGPNRWRAPQPVEPWSGVQDALQVSDACAQGFSPFSAFTTNNEDCLYLNVFTPTGAHGLPVMVWIHGGAFVVGSGNDRWYDGSLLAQQGVIVVTINYRLGALGFLAHPAFDGEDPGYPTSGNYGLSDQQAALAWVQRNISQFGGDPKRVTIFGESAGGWSNCIHYLSSKTSGLFAAAISESGLCDAPAVTLTHADALASGTTLATQLGCTGTGSAAAACLRGLSVDALLMATAGTPIAMQQPGGLFYQSSVPSLLPNVDGVVVEGSMAQLLAAGTFEPRPLLLGTNKDEGTLFTSSLLGQPVADATQYHDALARRFGSANADAIVARYPATTFATPTDALAEVTGDAFWVCPARRTARGVAAAGAPVFRYSFEHALENPLVPDAGVFHGSELVFVFGNDNITFGKIGASGAPLVPVMQGEWTGFAKTHAPGADWPAFDASTDPYQRLDVPTSAQQGLKSSLCDFWDSLAVP